MLVMADGYDGSEGQHISYGILVMADGYDGSEGSIGEVPTWRALVAPSGPAEALGVRRRRAPKRLKKNRARPPNATPPQSRHERPTPPHTPQRSSFLPEYAMPSQPAHLIRSHMAFNSYGPHSTRRRRSPAHISSMPGILVMAY